MKVIIHDVKESTFEEEGYLALSDETLNNENYVTLIGEQNGHDISLDVAIDDLHAALTAFIEKRQLQHQMQKRYLEEQSDAN